MGQIFFSAMEKRIVILCPQSGTSEIFHLVRPSDKNDIRLKCAWYVLTKSSNFCKEAIVDK